MSYKVEKSHNAMDHSECFLLASLMVHPSQICHRRCKVLCQAQLADPCLEAGVRGEAALNHSVAATWTEMQ